MWYEVQNAAKKDFEQAGNEYSSTNTSNLCFFYSTSVNVFSYFPPVLKLSCFSQKKTSDREFDP